MGCVTQIGEQALNVGRVAGSSRAGRRRSPRRRSTASAAPPCRRPSTRPRRSRPVTSTSSSRRASSRCRACRWGRTSASRAGRASTRSSPSAGRSSRRASPPRRSRRSGTSRARISTRTRSSRTAARSPRSTAACSSARSCRSTSRNGEMFTVDEAPRRDTSAEKLAGLKPAFIEDGASRPGNSSQIVDGAAAMLLVSEEACRAPRADAARPLRLVRIAGVDPFRMLHGNPQACAQALAGPGSAGTTWP